MSVEIVKVPYNRLIIDGWQVPGVEAIEEDGGTVLFLIDGRIGHAVPAGQFEAVARLIADAVAHTAGYGAHPSGDMSRDERVARFARASVLPTHWVEIGSVGAEEAAE